MAAPKRENLASVRRSQAKRLVAGVVASLALCGLVGASAWAQEDITKTPVSGTFDVGCELAASSADRIDSAACGLVDEGSGELLGCSDGGPGTTVRIRFTVDASSLPATVRAYAYSELGCAGVRSEQGSPNVATLQLGPPGSPAIVP